MDTTTIGTAIGIVAGAFVIIGLLFGLLRGWTKSLVRFLLVIAMAFLAFLITPAISKGVMTWDISNLGITMGGAKVSSVEAFIVSMLGSWGIDQTTLDTLPTVKGLAQNLPVLLLNIVVYMVFFLLLVLASLIIYWIICAVFFPKRKMVTKRKLRLVGAGIGAIQGLLIFVVFLIPTMGFVSMLNQCVTAIETEPTASPVAVVENSKINISNVSYSENEVYIATNSSLGIDDEIAEIKKYIKAYEENIVIKALNAIGYNKLADKAFDDLTTVTVNKEKVVLRHEFVNASEIVRVVDEIGGFDKDFTDADIANMKEIINKCYESKLIGRVVGEILPVAAGNWSNGEKFIIDKPQVGGELQRIVDALCAEFAKANETTIKADLLALTDVIKVLSDNNIMSALFGTNNADILTLVNKPGFVSSVIDKMLVSNTLKQIFPTVLDVGMQEMYKVVKLENATEYRVTKKSSDLTEVEWLAEKQTLGNLFENLISFAVNLNNKPSITIDDIDMAVLGRAFDGMRSSIFLGANSKNVVIGILQSDFVNGAIPTSFINKVESDWNTINFIATFNVVKASLDINNQISTEGELTTESVQTLIENLGADGMEGVIEDIATEENLQEMGLGDKTAGAVNEIVTNISQDTIPEDTDYDKETAAMERMITMFNLLSNPANTQDIVTETNATGIVDDLFASEVVVYSIDPLGTSANLIQAELDGDAEQATLIQNAINAKAVGITDGAQQLKLNTIADLFGVARPVFE